MNRGITQKQYLELVPPTEEDARSSQMRILDALKEKGITASFTLPALQKLYPICDEADYNITVSLAWNGSIWQAVDLEAGDTAAEHYGYAAVLATMEECQSKIEYALASRSFGSDYQKASYLMAILTNNINDVARRLKSQQEFESRQAAPQQAPPPQDFTSAAQPKDITDFLEGGD